MKRNTNHKGFTLIELLVVLSIIGLLGAVVGPQVMKHLGGAKTKSSKLQVEDFGAALDMFYMDNGRYPNSQEGLNALVQAPTGIENWNGPYMKKKKIPKDPWKREYHYESPGQNGPYDLYSYGADNAQGGEKENADILSWE
ncbi:MAG: type II secretion system major pseudopilin GspG [Gammaproteobacteria bacterium]|nr:type II secretion system major pseudopilin GspG [Gammaproteobacteria bacterium]